LYKRGPASGQFSTNPNTTRIQLFIAGGGGRGQPDSPFTGKTGGRGGPGGFGYFNIATPSGIGPVAYTVGSGGFEPTNAAASTFAHPSGTITANAGTQVPHFQPVNPNTGTGAAASPGTLQSPAHTVGVTFENVYDFNALAGFGNFDGSTPSTPGFQTNMKYAALGSVPAKASRGHRVTQGNSQEVGPRNGGPGILLIRENASD